MHILFLTRIVPGKPLGHSINISLTLHYNPITQPMFTAILVSLLWLDSFYFIQEFITHTSHLPIEKALPPGPQWWKIYLPQYPLESSENACGLICCLIKIVSSMSIHFQLCQGSTWSRQGRYSGRDLFTPTADSSWQSERALTADLRALVQAVLAVVLPVTQPLFGDALVLWAGELVPQAWRVCRGQRERIFNAINQTKWGGNHNKSGIPYRRGRAHLIETQQVGWLLFAPWLACFSL